MKFVNIYLKNTYFLKSGECSMLKTTALNSQSKEKDHPKVAKKMLISFTAVFQDCSLPNGFFSRA